MTEGGYKGSALQALLKAVPEAHVLNPITEKHSKEQATDETWMDAIEEPGELERDNTMIGGENGKGMV